MLHLSTSRVRTARSLLVAAAACLAIPASASADIPITSFKAGPVKAFSNPSGFPLAVGGTDTNDLNCSYLNPAGPTLSTQAGAITDYCISFTTTPGNPITGEDIKNSLVELPVGTLAQVDLQAKCTEAEFAETSNATNTCPGASQVGTAHAGLDTPAGPKDAPGRIYALDTPADKAAKFGVALLADGAPPFPESKFEIVVSQEGTATIGLLNQTSDLKQTVPSAPLAAFGGAPIAIKSNSLRFWGNAAAHPHAANPFNPALGAAKMTADFFRIGTTCQTPQTTKIAINPYTTPTQAYPGGVFGVAPVPSVDRSASVSTNAATTYQLTGCESLPFNPTFKAALTGETNPGGHPGLQIDIGSPEGDEDLGATTITLPQGVATDLSRIQNACPAATFFARGCTPAQIIGRVSATLSGINADVPKGDIYMVKVDGEALPALGLDFQGRLPLRLAGVSKINSTGRIANTFTALPSIPQRSLSVTLFGAEKGILQMEPGNKCTTSAYDATLAGQNGKTKSFAQLTLCKEQFIASLKKSNKTTPTLSFSGAGATGKKIQSLKLSMPGGLTINKNVSKTGFKVDKLRDEIKKKLSPNRLSSKTLRLTIPKPGSSGLRILTRTKTLKASNKFRKGKTAISLTARVVYTDGTKATVAVPISRK